MDECHEHICFKEKETEAQKNDGFPRVIGDKQEHWGLSTGRLARALPKPLGWAAFQVYLFAGRQARKQSE